MWKSYQGVQFPNIYSIGPNSNGRYPQKQGICYIQKEVFSRLFVPH